MSVEYVKNVRNMTRHTIVFYGKAVIDHETFPMSNSMKKNIQ